MFYRNYDDDGRITWKMTFGCKVKRFFHKIKRSLGFFTSEEKYLKLFTKEFMKNLPTQKEIDELSEQREERNKRLRPRRDFSLDELREIDEAATKERERQQAVVKRNRDLYATQDKVQTIIDESVQKIEKMISDVCGEEWQEIRVAIGKFKTSNSIDEENNHWTLNKEVYGMAERVPETMEEILATLNPDPNEDAINLRNYIIASFVEKINVVFTSFPDKEIEEKIWLSGNSEVQKVIPSKELQDAVKNNDPYLNWMPKELKTLIIEGKPIPIDILNKDVEKVVKRKASNEPVRRIVNQ